MEMDDDERILSGLGYIFLSWRRYLQKAVVDQGITLKQVALLGELTNRQFLYPAEIAEMLFCDRPTAAVIIKNLEKNGLLRREKDKENGKRQRIIITEAGKRKFRSARKAVMERKNTFSPLGCFSAEKKNDLAALIAVMEKHMETLKASD